MTIDSVRPDDAAVTPLQAAAPPPPPSRAVPDPRATPVTDYASTARLVNDILSLGSDQSAPVATVASIAASAPVASDAPVASAVPDASAAPDASDPSGREQAPPPHRSTRPRPVPEAPQPTLVFPGSPVFAEGMVSPDFFPSTQPKKRFRLTR